MGQSRFRKQVIYRFRQLICDFCIIFSSRCTVASAASSNALNSVACASGSSSMGSSASDFKPQVVQELAGRGKRAGRPDCLTMANFLNPSRGLPVV